MKELTLLQAIAGGFIFLSSFIAALVYLYGQYKKATLAMLDGKFDETNKKVDNLQADMNERFEDMDQKRKESDYEACKNFLVHALHDIEQGADDEILKERVHEQYKHYKKMDGNSYIESRIKKLEGEGKL